MSLIFAYIFVRVVVLATGGFADWTPAEWIMTIGGAAGVILGAWAKYEGAKNKQQIQSVGKQADRNSEDVREVRNQVTDVATKSISPETAKMLLYSTPPAKPWFEPPPEEPTPPPTADPRVK